MLSVILSQNLRRDSRWIRAGSDHTLVSHTRDHWRQVHDPAPPQAPTRAAARAQLKNPSGSDSRRRITAKREPREVRVEQSSTTEHHVPRRLFGKTTPQGHSVPVTTQVALDGSREKTVRIANVENIALNWVSISSGESLVMTHCDFSARVARDEMRHIVGSCELDVVIGSDKDRNRGC